MSAWRAWDLDWLTWSWIGWLVAFVVLETVALVQGKGEELTAHVRPVFLEQPLTWWLGLGAWLWLGFHFLWPAAERGLQRMVSTY